MEAGTVISMTKEKQQYIHQHCLITHCIRKKGYLKSNLTTARKINKIYNEKTN